MDLIEFLRARLDEDEFDARAAMPSAVHRPASADRASHDDVQRAAKTMMSAAPPNVQATYRHANRWSPTRVLREVYAKRHMIDEILSYEATIDGEWGCGHTAEQIGHGECPRKEPSEIAGLRLLAVAWSDHPDHDKEW